MQRAAKRVTFAGLVLGGLLLVAWLVANKLAVLAITQAIDVPAASQLPPLPQDAAARARGGHLVRAVFGCASCHGPDLAGQQLLDDPGRARVAAANLTQPRRDVDTWVHAIRHGVRSDGRGLWLMPNDAYRGIVDADLVAAIAYLQTLPAVRRSWPPNRLYLGGRIAVARGRWHLVTGDSPRVAAADVDRGDPAAYGAYLFQVARCASCHAAATLPRRDPAALAAVLGGARTPAGRAVDAHQPLAAGYRELDAAELAALAHQLGQ